MIDCIYCTDALYCTRLSDDDVNEYCVQGPCPIYESPSSIDRWDFDSPIDSWNRKRGMTNREGGGGDE